MAQVKFYSVTAASYASAEKQAGGVYFVDGGELYKGTSRFGANKVFTKGEGQDLASFASVGQIGGDILVGIGAAKVWDASAAEGSGSWVDLGADNTALQSLWRSDISTWTSGLVQSGEGSYITGITQGDDGKVTASASNFATDVKTAIGNGSATSTANGITVDVVTTSGSVTSVSVSAANITATSVTADSGTFTNLTVSDTAAFNATTVSASNLTVGGSTIEQLADKQIAAIAASTVTSTATGITVGVTTQGGSVTAVSVNAESFGNTMHFRGVAASTADVSDPVAGDIVVIGAEPTGGAVAGQEYIYTTASTWELIGDQNTYALNAYAPGTENVTAGTTTLPAATHAIASKVDDIAAALSDFTYSSVTGGSSSSTVNGVTVEVVTAATTAVPTVSLTGVGTAASVDFATTVTSDGTALPTQSAVATAIQNAALVWLDANGDAI